MRISVSLLLLCCTLLSSQLRSQHQLSADEPIEITTDLEHLPDANAEFNSPGEIPSGKFLPIHDSAFDPLVKIYWLKFSLINPGERDREFILDFQNWSLVDLHYGTLNDLSLKQTGHLLPYSERDYAIANKSYVDLMIRGGDTLDCYVRLESRYNNEMVPTSLAFTVAPKSIVESENNVHSRIIYFFLGIFTVIFVYNFFLALSTGVRSYWFYLPVVMFAFYHTAYNSGYLIPIMGWWEDFPTILTWFETISSALFSIVVLLFTQVFLKTAERYPKLHRFMNWNMILWVASVLLAFVAVELGMLLMLVAAIAVVVLVVIAAIKSVRDSYPAAVFFLVGFSAFMIGALITVLAAVGALPMTKFTFNYAFPLGSVIEVSLFSLALANLINVLKHENEKKQARIIEQLEENQQLQTKVNRELEQKVQERTKQINEQKDLISAQKDEISQEKEKSDRLLTNILPESVAEELKEYGKATPKSIASATVMFADFRGFTKLSSEFTPDQLVTQLDYCFKAFDDIISRNNLEKIKTIGDAYMAVAGVPEEDENHAVNACNAALEIVEFIEEWKKELQAKGHTPWEVRVGINSGQMVAGVVGKKKFSFDVWGDSVNIASRMESHGIPGKVNISSNTHELIGSGFSCEHQGKVEIKGKGIMDMYTVEAKVV